MTNRTRIGILASILLLGQGPTAATAGINTWDVSEVFSNADGTIQFVELVEAGGGNFQTRGSKGTISRTPKFFSWSTSPVTNTGLKKYSFAPQPSTHLSAATTPTPKFTTKI